MKHKTNLEKSHSPFSNFLLTAITLPAAVCFPGLFALCAFDGIIPDAALLPLAAVFALLSLLSLLFICIFRR